MNAPSPLCLRALRSLALPTATPICISTRQQRRCYAAIPDRPRPPPPPPPPPRSTKPTPPQGATTAPPTPAVFRPNPSGPDLRRKRDDDEDFTPYPLSRPIGMPNPPQPGTNTGLDRRTLKQRRDDFHNYEKHLERRASMTKQIAKPYFRDWSNMRFHKGKVFLANERLFRSEHALWFPNFFGKTLQKGGPRGSRKDGYSGYGRDTTAALRGKVSVVSIVSNTWAESQVATFCSPEQNPELHGVLRENKDLAQRVEVNYEDNFLKYWILQIFARSNLRRARTVQEQGLYFMVRRGVSDLMKEAIGLLNDKGGYVYLVDQDCKIRWAGSAEARPEEKESMVKGLSRLIQEARMPIGAKVEAVEHKERLQAAVTEVMEEEVASEKTAAAGGG